MTEVRLTSTDFFQCNTFLIDCCLELFLLLLLFLSLLSIILFLSSYAHYLTLWNYKFLINALNTVLYNYLVLGHTKYEGVQRIYCDPFPNKKFYSNHRMDLVFVRPPVVQPGGFFLIPDSVWYCRVLLLFSASALTDTGSKSFDCSLVSTLETCRATEKGNYFDYFDYFKLFHSYLTSFVLEWLKSVGSGIIYELDPKNPILYVLLIENILGKLQVVPVGALELIPHCLRMRVKALTATADRGMGKAAKYGM